MPGATFSSWADRVDLFTPFKKGIFEINGFSSGRAKETSEAAAFLWRAEDRTCDISYSGALANRYLKMASISLEPIHVFEPDFRRTSYTNHIFGGLILIGTLNNCMGN
jgi:hypothetical protein